MSNPSVAVVFLARGYEQDHLQRFRRFLRSYIQQAAGCDHKLYVIFKGFQNSQAENDARMLFASVPHSGYSMEDSGFDIGAYARMVREVEEDFVSFFNSHSEIMAENWLYKLVCNLRDPSVGMVGATGSYESLNYIHPDFPPFPNPHLRTNAFMLRVSHARQFFSDEIIQTKADAWRFESGAHSLTQQVFAVGLSCLIVGRNGCGYGHRSWMQSETYRQGLQSNLLVLDNVTRSYNCMLPNERASAIKRTWGEPVPPKSFTFRKL